MSALPSTAINEADVIIGERIGVGCSVAVFRATWNGLTLAAKMMITMSFPIYGVEPGSDNHKRITSTLMKAADLHHGVDHPNILTYYGIVRDGAFPALPKYILNELASCDLESYLRTQWSKGGLPLPLLLAIAEDVMAALVCFHGHRLPILHSGVRADNVLVFPQPRGRPTFKLNCPLSAVYCTAAGVVEEDTYCDHYFRAPEVFGETGYTTKADVFSFGVMLADIVLQYMAVPGYPAIPNPHDYFGMDWHRRNQEAAVRLSVVCPPLGDVLARCCAADPADRFRSMDAWLAIREISTVSPVLPSLAAGGSVEPMSESVTPPSPPVDDGCGSPPAAP